jgi:hypothetical protein
MIRKSFAVAAILSTMTAQSSFAAFSKCGFNVGVDLAQASTAKCNYMGCTQKTSDLDLPAGVDFVAKFTGHTDVGGGPITPAPQNTQEGTFLAMAKSLNATPVWYTYIIAEGLKSKYPAGQVVDCNQGSNNLCKLGADYIRNSRSTILDQYRAFAQFAASKWGTTQPMIWALEPDYYQYASSDNGNSNPVSYADASKLIADIADVIKTAMPNAQISMDVSPWAPENWITSLPLSKFNYMNTSGGVSSPSGTIKDKLTWKRLNELTKLPIIADDGYGTGGTATNPNSGWADVNNIKARMADGVVGLMQAYPKSAWTSVISNIHSQTATNCGSKFTLTLTAGTGGSVTSTPSVTSFDSGAVVSLKAVPLAKYAFAGWSGAVTGTKDTISVVMNGNKSVTAAFSRVYPKYTLTISTLTSGTITANPSAASYDSGAQVGLKAKANQGFLFSNWIAGASGTSDTTNIVMDANKSVSAIFKPSTSVIVPLRNSDRIRLRSNQLAIRLERVGPTEFSIVSADGRSLQHLGAFDLHGQELVFGLESSPRGLQFLRIRGEGGESIVPLTVLAR